MLCYAIEPERLMRDVLLRDRSTLRLRATSPADVDDIKAFYDGLSSQRRYIRVYGRGRTDSVARAASQRTEHSTTSTLHCGQRLTRARRQAATHSPLHSGTQVVSRALARCDRRRSEDEDSRR
jgi:hypothetical protein